MFRQWSFLGIKCVIGELGAGQTFFADHTTDPFLKEDEGRADRFIEGIHVHEVTAAAEEFFIEPLWWSGDSETLFFIRRSRNQWMLDVCAADPTTGASRVVVEERLDGMVYARPMVELGDGRLLWWGIRDGWGHYSLHGPDGSLISQLTGGEFNVETVVAVDEEEGVAFISANGRENG